MTQSTPILSIDQLDIERGGRAILKGCSLQVSSGEHVVIVGTSGGGKSTLLNVIADGHPKLDSTGGQPTMVLQEGALLDHLNVRENLELVARYQGKSEAVVPSLLNMLNIGAELFESDTSQLSGGQMRRVAIARALVNKPKLILFDEPDAGLDVANLDRLAETVRNLVADQGRSCVTVSHNPFYIARVATKVYKLIDGKLSLLFDWSTEQSPDYDQRQSLLQTELVTMVAPTPNTQSAAQRKKATSKLWWPFLVSLKATLSSLFYRPKSLKSEAHIFAYSFFLNFLTGAAFFILVGLMLGATTVAVVKTLADNALTGLVSWFIEPQDLIEIMRGRFALYLAPAVGGMLFVARSGSIVSNWLGDMVRSRKVRAIGLLGVDPKRYLIAPNLFAVFLGMLLALCLFCLAIWIGGVISTELLFDIDNAHQAMLVSAADVQTSQFWQKSLLYSAITALLVSAFAFAEKTTAHQVNIHTTKCIIYSTVMISLAEMLLILI